MTRVGLSGSAGPVMAGVRQISIGSGFDDDGTGFDVGVLIGLRTRGKSFLSGAIGTAKTEFSPSFCLSQCSKSTGKGITYEVGAHAALPWMSFGLIYSETRAGPPMSWHGVTLTVGVGTFR